MKFFKSILIIFLLFEICFSFYRYLYFPMDGDMVSVIYGYSEVKHDPFGVNVLLHDSIYGGPNRYFATQVSAKYIKNAPLVFQLIASPIDSIYLAGAFFKIFTQFFLVYILSVMITGKKKLWDFDLLLAAALITPLFQTFGYNEYMGIIQGSVSYTFFYGFAFCWIVLLFLPFFNAAFQRRSFRFSPMMIIGLILLAVFNAFNGPLNPPVMLIICSFTLFYAFVKRINEIHEGSLLNKIIISIKNIPPHLVVIFTICILLGLYSLYIGKNNSENLWATISVHKRYERLWQGIYRTYTNKLGPALLIIMIIINRKIIQRNRQLPLSENILKALQWFLWIALIYIFLLPLGGYRSYRPFILRNDTLVPVSVGLILFYGLTTFHVLRNIKLRYKFVYYIVIMACTMAYINADTKVLKLNTCEINALTKIAESKEDIVFVDNDCSVMNWGKVMDYNDTKHQTELLQYWGVIKNKKLYYQK